MPVKFWALGVFSVETLSGRLKLVAQASTMEAWSARLCSLKPPITQGGAVLL